MMTPGRLLYWLTFIQRGSIRCHADSVSTHQALGCELGHLVDHTVGKVQHTYTEINTQREDSVYSTVCFSTVLQRLSHLSLLSLLCCCDAICAACTSILSCLTASPRTPGTFLKAQSMEMVLIVVTMKLDARLYNFPVSPASKQACVFSKKKKKLFFISV